MLQVAVRQIIFRYGIRSIISVQNLIDKYWKYVNQELIKIMSDLVNIETEKTVRGKGIS